LALAPLFCVLLARASDAAQRQIWKRIMELRSYGVAKIMRRRHRPVGDTREGIEDVEDRLRTVGYPLGAASGGRNRRSAFASDLSTIAASIRFIAGIAAIAVLYFGRDVFVPLAVAVLLTFILAPPVRLLRRWRLGRMPSIIIVVLIAFLAIFGLGTVLGEQVSRLAAALPKYQETITKKIDRIRGATAGTGTLGEASHVLRDLGRELNTTQPNQLPSQPTEQKPVPVEVHQPEPAPLQVIRRIMSPLVDPLMTTGIIIIFVMFFLAKREDLRDRLIGLAGSTDLQRTTAALDDAGSRLSRYLLAQTALNTAFGIIIGGGLALIGIPNPVLWGILAGVLRFVPYIGALIAAAFPLALAVAVDPGWSKVIVTGALFLLVETILGQVVEPMLYAHRTGVSPVAVIVAAMFWTWLWGPIGLLLSTPLTVCLSVLGRHVDRLRFLDVILGSRPPLTPEQSFYHRTLSGNSDEAFEQAEDMLKTMSLSTYYDEVALEGLRLAELDARHGRLDHVRVQKVRTAVEGLVADLSDFDDAAPPGGMTSGRESAQASEGRKPESSELPVLRQEELAGEWASTRPVLCIPGPSPLDEAATVILAQILEKHGIGVQIRKHHATSSSNEFQLGGEGVALVCVSYLDVGDAPARIRATVRRVRRQLPRATVLAGLWGPNNDHPGEIRAELSADLYARSFCEAAKRCIEAAAPGRRPPQASVHLQTLSAQSFG
jgi:predicted PurR-regulated permease PerM